MYNIETAVRKMNGEERKVRVLSGIGNLTNDVEVRRVKRKDSGEEIAVVGNFGLSIAFDYFRNGKKEAVFYPIEAWGKTAESLGKIGKKGMELSVVGRLEERSYETKTGKKYINEVLVLEKFQVTSRGWKNNEGNQEAIDEDDTEAIDVEGFEEIEDDEDIPF